VAETIIRLLREMQEDAEFDLPETCDLDTPLFGAQGILDSMALVDLIVALEQALEAERSVRISLADERALSQQHSPYRTIGTLAEYAVRAAQASA
jgi:acyl carrier protein